MTDLAKLEEAETRERPGLEAAMQRARAGRAKESQCRRWRDDTKSALAAAEAERKAIELAAAPQGGGERLKGARAAAADITTLAAALDGNGADEGVMAAVRREAQAIATLEARLSAAAPTVSVAYARGGQGKIKVGGRPLEDGETLSPTRPLALEIEGVGVLTVAPGPLEGVAEDEADLAAHAAELAALLQRIGAVSLETAEARAAERRDAARQARRGASAAQGAGARGRRPRWSARYADLSAKAPAAAAHNAERVRGRGARARAFRCARCGRGRSRRGTARARRGARGRREAAARAERNGARQIAYARNEPRR